MASTAALPVLTLSFDRLRLATPTDAAKRKAVGHYGASIDSSLAVALVALSRLLKTREPDVLEPASRSPIGVALLAALRAAVLRVARSTGGADAALSEANVETFFNQSASTIASQRLYSGNLSLPARLPWASAKALLAALLDSISAAATTPLGVGVASVLASSGPPAVDAQSAAAALAASIEAGMLARLVESGGASSSASGRSTPPAPPLPMPPPPPLPIPLPAQQAFAIDAGQSMAANATRLVEARLQRPLAQSEGDELERALEEGLSVLQAGGAEARRSLLRSSVLVALTKPPAAQLWAAVLEASERDVPSLAALAAAIVDACSNLTAMLFASALGL
jgi:hypothetical protein